MVSFWKVVLTLSAKAKKPPGLRHLPYSLEESLFFAQRTLLATIINTTNTAREQRFAERQPYTFQTILPTAPPSVEEDPFRLLQSVLTILFQLPHLDQLMHNHFSETENIIRIVANTYFSNATEPEVLALQHRLAATVLESSAEHLTTANLIILTTLLQREDLFGGGGHPAMKKGTEQITGAARTSRFAGKSSASARLQESRRMTGGEAAKRYQQMEPQGSEAVTGSSFFTPDGQQDHAREALLRRVYGMFLQRLQRNAENGFLDDNLTQLCVKPAMVRGFHALQTDSIVQSMSFAEFSFFLVLLNDRIKRNLSSIHSSSSGLKRVSNELITTVGQAMDRLSLFHSLEVIAQHRAIEVQELKFIIDIAISPIPSWSSKGLQVFRKFVISQRQHKRGEDPNDVLSTMPVDDQMYVRGQCLHRLSSASLNQLAECFFYMLPLFVSPVVVETTGKVRWVPSSTLYLLTMAQKKRFFSVARSTLYLLRSAPSTLRIVQSMTPAPATHPPFADDEVLMEVLCTLSDYFLEHHMDKGGQPPLYRNAKLLKDMSSDNEADKEHRKAIQKVMLQQERLRAYFSVCEYALLRWRCNWLTSSENAVGPFHNVKEQRYFDCLVTQMLPEDDSTEVKTRMIPQLLRIKVLYGVFDILSAVFTFFRTIAKPVVVSPHSLQKLSPDLVFLPTPTVAEQLEVALLHSLQHIVTQKLDPPIRTEHMEQVMRYLVQTLTASYLYSQSLRHKKMSEDKEGGVSAPVAAAQLASVCLDQFLAPSQHASPSTKEHEALGARRAGGQREEERTDHPTRGGVASGTVTAPISVAVLAVVLLNGLVLPPHYQHLQKRAMDKETLIQLFGRFGVEYFSLPQLYELLALVFTRRERATLSAPGSRAMEEDGTIAAIDAADVSVLEAAVQATRRTSFHHNCYEGLSLQERVRIVEHCARIYMSVYHRFYTLELAQMAGIRCISACAYLSLEHQLVLKVGSESGRNAEYEKRRLQLLGQALWHFYALAMGRPVHSGPQVEKYMSIIFRFLKKRVSSIPFRHGAPSAESAVDLHLITQESRSVEKDLVTLHVQWKDLAKVRKINNVFVAFVEKLSLQNLSRFAERIGAAPPSAKISLEGSDDVKDNLFILTDTESALLSTLTPQEQVIVHRNVTLRRALRHPLHGFQMALSTVRDNLSARRGVQLSELYMILLHAHTQEILPSLWKEVCSQLMYFRQIYQRAESPGICVLDTKQGREVQQILQQVLVAYLKYETQFQEKDSGMAFMDGALDLASMAFLYSSAAEASKGEPLLLGGRGTGLRPADLTTVAAVLEHEVGICARSKWKDLSEKQYANQVHMLHRSLRDLLA